MESVSRMTRSKARALGTTPTPAMPSKSEAKTTGRRRKGAAKLQEQQSEETSPRQLRFSEEPPAQEQVPADQQPVNTEGSKQEYIAEPPLCQIAPRATSLAGAMNLDDSDVHAETHDNPSVLMASPIILTPKEQPISANLEPVSLNFAQTTFVTDALDVKQSVASSPLSIAMDDTMFSPLVIAARPLPIDVSPHQSVASPREPAASPLPDPVPMEASPLPGAIEGSPLGGVVQPHVEEDAAQSPGDSAVEGSPIAALTPHSFRSDAPRTGAPSTPQPMVASIPASPLSLTAEAIESANFSPMPEDDFLDSPISLSGATEPTPSEQPQLADDGVELEGMEQMDDGDEMMADATPPPPNQDIRPNDVSPLSFASDCRIARPGTEPSPLPAFAGVPSGRESHHSSTPPAPQVSSFQGFAAVFPTPEDSELEPYSPSLAGLMSANAPSPSMFLVSAGVATSGAATALSPSSVAITQDSADVTAMALGSCIDPLQTNALSTTPPTSAPEVNPTLAAECAGGSCTLSVSSQHHAGNTIFSPLGGSCMPPAPAPTPESGELSTWTLLQTPLAVALAVSVSNAEEGQCEDAGEVAEPNSHVDASNPREEQGMEDIPASSPVQDMEMDDAVKLPQSTTTPSVLIASAQTTPVPPSSAPAAKVSILQGRSPAVGPVFRNSGATPTPVKTAVKPLTPARSNYLHVESRYNKTPTTGTTAVRSRPSIAATSSAANGVTSTTPSASTSAAPGTKSVKRVSIHTPEGPRSAAPHRQVIPTPFRPKSAAQSSSLPFAEAPLVERSSASVVAQPQQQSQTSILVEDRRAKAAERLKTIHATEQGSATGVAVRPSSGPGYLAPTQAFTVKSSAKALKGKVEVPINDPRSLRQLKKEVKETVTKKEAKVVMTEARSSKLTPKVPEQQLPMPDDDDTSDDQAEYNEGQENDLVAAMTGLEVAPPKKSATIPLRGLPAPQGRHIRFNDTGKASESPLRTVLRGLPLATGKYKRFE